VNQSSPVSDHRPQVVIIGGGFGGLEAARELADAPVDVTVLDRRNYHLFQPLLYQVATAALSPSEIAWPIRHLLRRQSNARGLLAEAVGVDIETRCVQTSAGDPPFDYLVVATGATHSYFGHPEWSDFAPGLKTIEDATAIRRRVLCAFEQAENAQAADREALLTFVIVGGGPTGVEMAGAVAELARDALARDFRHIDPREAKVVLVEAGERVLAAFPEQLAAYAARMLERLGVTVMTKTAVTGCGADGVELGERRLASQTVIWAAGVAASPLAVGMAGPHDRAGRVIVLDDLSLEGQPDVFVIGDAAAMKRPDGSPVPGIAPAAKQAGRHAAKIIAARVAGRKDPGAFRYRHAGDLATIGRSAAVVRFDGLRLTGWIGWVFWGLAHIYFLIGLRNRVAVAFDWSWSWLTRQRHVRLIIG
jgi:NADH dehydrogenase